MRFAIISALVILIISCSKGSQSSSTTQTNYIGRYFNTKGDTADVSKLDDTYTKIRWAQHYVPDPGVTYTTAHFDSVKVASDLTFTTNEILRNQIFPNWNGVRLTGTGAFGTNTIHFSFTMQGSSYPLVDFTGVK